jgi:hypothetical protein
MNPEIEQLKKQVADLEAKFKLLYSSTTIPLDIAEAFRTRLADDARILRVSSRTAASETQAVNEAGMATYSVGKPMNGFVTVVLNGVQYDLAYYT